MKYKKLVFTLMSAAVLSCSTNDRKPDLSKMVNDFSELECKAIALREKRFALANQIRFTQDTLMHTANKADTPRLKLNLQGFNLEKESVLQVSLQLSEVIKQRLDSLMHIHITSRQQKERFNQMLDSALQARGCR